MSAFTKQFALLGETAAMAFDTIRSNKMRSALTVLGVVIGVTSIVGMTSLIRGFDTSLRNSINSLGPNTIFVQKFGIGSFSSSASFMTLMRRPNITLDDMKAIERHVDDGRHGRHLARRRRSRQPGRDPARVLPRRAHPADADHGHHRAVRRDQLREDACRPHRSPSRKCSARGQVAVVGYGVYEALFEKRGIDPIGKPVRVGDVEYTVIGVIGKRPSPGGFGLAPTTSPSCRTRRSASSSATRTRQRGPFGIPVMIAVLPKEGVAREDAMREVEAIMRIRHGLTLDKPNDFDLVTSDAILAVWDQISAAILLALVVISSIALMVGGIGVMAIMTISVTERTREIGVRKAIGARRREILVQFLIEAAVLTSVGGILGVLMGSAIGLLVNVVSGFPVSLPWWSFALGLGFSASIGIFFGMLPAWRASRLDPIEALRYE